MKDFKSLGLQESLLTAIEKMGYRSPSEIQQKTIPYLLNHPTDFIGLAQTGTGKTAAFGLPLLQKIDPKNRQTQGLILAPTRELCRQITGELTQYAQTVTGINIVAIYGGASMSSQEKEINRGAQIIVATPGRMKDMLKRRKLDITGIAYCVLDEADEMLNMGFYEDLTAILKYSPKDKQTWLFSATMPDQVAKIAGDFMTHPMEVTVGAKNEGTQHVAHHYYKVPSRGRYKVLKRLVDRHPDIFAVIFCRTKRETRNLAEKLAEEGYNAAALHGDLSQNQRDVVMKSFRNHHLQILVATDVASRGIDVNNISHVINYRLPDEPEIYTHRSGRTGRAGKDGVSIVLATNGELKKIKKIEKIINQKFLEKDIPGGDEICKGQLRHRAKTIKETPIDPHIEKYLPLLEKKFEDLNKTELLKKVFSAEFSKFHEYYRNAPNLNEKVQQAGQQEAGTRYFISMGAKDGFDWKSLKDLLCKELKMTREEVTQVDVKNNFSFFNTDTAAREKVFAKFKDYPLHGRKVHVEITRNKKNRKKATQSHGKRGQRKKRSYRSRQRKRNK